MMKCNFVSLVSFFLIVLFSLSACNVKEKKSSITSTLLIDGKGVEEQSYSSRKARYQIYDNLCRIYDVRRFEAESYIYSSLVDKEAHKLSVSADSFLNQYVAQRMSDKSIQYTIEQNSIGEWIDAEGEYVATASDKGMKALRKLAKQEIVASLVDSLKRVHDVHINLAVPVGPLVNYDSLDCIRITSHDKNVWVTLIVDPLCTGCRKAYRHINQLANQKDSNFAFQVIISADDIQTEALSIAAANQFSFGNQMLHLVMSSTSRLTIDEILIEVQRQGVDPSAFRKAMEDPLLKSMLEKQNERLRNQMVWQTPAVLVNKHLVYRGAQIDILTNEILKAKRQTDKK